ncbi:putative Frataxin, mitochondrial [Hypsibius exemplaris]|uniref:ferroxidase n=1 Tax=Hypsibius exemplaris TaxID=2072580 RepID=A0A1W0WZ30_HYPEX|nr:putative Frataxin, mitochondrial [Hypsibius exemplaris]
MASLHRSARSFKYAPKFFNLLPVPGLPTGSGPSSYFHNAKAATLRISTFPRVSVCLNQLPVERFSRKICSVEGKLLPFQRRDYIFTGAPKDERKKPTELPEKRYHEIADETLESLTTTFEELVDTGKCHSEFDVMYSSGVLTLRLTPTCTYVINKQTPNRQIWFSSPHSGPKRYDFVGNSWVYLHDNSNLHDLLSEEVSQELGVPVDFRHCAFGRT